MCNLSEVVVRSTDTPEDVKRKARIATILGTFQASLTDFKFIGEEWTKNTREEALLGVSMTGVMDNELFSGQQGHEKLAEVLQQIRDYTVEVNAEWADKLGINPAAAITCNKPSGCQKEDTMLITDKGILSFAELGDLNGEQWQDHNFKVAQERSMENSTKFYVNGFATTKRILLDGGLELESTWNHKYRVLRNGEYMWVTAEDVVLGDKMPYRVGGYESTDDIKLLKLNLEDYSLNNKAINQPDTLNEDLAWLLGLYFGDGSNHSKGIRISGDARDIETLYKAQRIIKEQFGIEALIYGRSLKGQVLANNSDLYANSQMLLRWLALNGLLKQKGPEIEIPVEVRMSSKKTILAFVDGYAHADGSFKTNGLSFCTTSKRWAEQLVVVLRAVGVDCKMRLMPPTESSLGNRMRYWISVRKGRAAESRYISRVVRATYEELDAVGMDNLSFDTVVEVTDGACNTYDIEVPSNNCYVANSYISHNTVSCLVDSGSGIHTRHAEYYIRTVRTDKKDPLYAFMKEEGVPVEDCYLKPETTAVFSFPMKAPEGALTRDSLTAIEQLEVWLTYQRHWCHHKPSVTINVKEHEWPEVGAWVWKHFDEVSGVSFLPHSNHTYKQAPYTELSKDMYEKCIEMFPMPVLNWQKLSMFELTDSTTGTQNLACTAGGCDIL